MTIDSTLGESITFANPTASLTINAGSDSDTINIEGVDGAYSANLIVNGDAGSDLVNFQTTPTNIGTGALTLSTDRVEVLTAVTANGGIMLQPEDDASAIALGTAAATFHLEESELTNLASTGTFTIGRATGFGPINIADAVDGNLNLSGESYQLTLRGGTLTFGAGLTLGSDRALTLQVVAITSPHLGTDVTIGGSAGQLSITASGQVGAAGAPLTMDVRGSTRTLRPGAAISFSPS